MRHLSYVMAFLATGSGFALLTAAGCFPFAYESSGVGGGGTSTTGGGMPCSATPACNDDNPCTVDACTKGFCENAPLTMNMVPGSTECMTIDCEKGTPTTTIHDGSLCDKVLKCVGSVCTGCTVDADCGKTDECQTSICKLDLTCMYSYMPIGTKVKLAKLPDDMSGDCMSTICNGTGTKQIFVDDTDLPDDMLDCTDGHCADGKPAQLISAVGTACAGGGKFCNSTQSCVKCAVDTNCPAPATCYMESTCVSCTDVSTNGDETDIDCGGSCAQKCLDGKDCKNRQTA